MSLKAEGFHHQVDRSITMNYPRQQSMISCEQPISVVSRGFRLGL
jgi:hypothetical protein